MSSTSEECPNCSDQLWGPPYLLFKG